MYSSVLSRTRLPSTMQPACAAMLNVITVASYAPTKMLLMGMCTSLTTKPMTPMMMKPVAVACNTLRYSATSLVQNKKKSGVDGWN